MGRTARSIPPDAERPAAVSAAAPARLARAFAARRGHTSLIPFVTAGYPSPAGTLELLRGLAALPVLAIEIGIPFSDPIADGPEIQRSSERALAAGIGPRETLALVREFRVSSQLPVVLMTYANPVLRIGATTFAAEAKDAGVDGLIVSDLPPDEAPATWDAFDQAGLDTVILIAPTTDPARLPVLLARCRGFVYCRDPVGLRPAGRDWIRDHLGRPCACARRHRRRTDRGRRADACGAGRHRGERERGGRGASRHRARARARGRDGFRARLRRRGVDGRPHSGRPPRHNRRAHAPRVILSATTKADRATSGSPRSTSDHEARQIERGQPFGAAARGLATRAGETASCRLTWVDRRVRSST